MIDELRQGRLDLAACILDQVPDDIYGKQLGSDGYSCLINPAHPLTHKSLTLDEYCQADHIGISAGGDKIRTVDDALAQQKRSRRLMLTVPFIHSALAITACSEHILTLPSHIALALAPRYQLKVKPLPAELALPSTDYYLIWHQRLHNDPAHRYLRERLYTSLKNNH